MCTLNLVFSVPWWLAWSFDKISPWIVFGRYLFQAGSAGLNQQRKFLYWPLGGLTYHCNMVLALKLSNYTETVGVSGFLDIPYCEGVPWLGCGSFRFWTFCFRKKRWQQIFGLRIHMRFLDVPYRLSLVPQKADSTVGEYASVPCLGPFAGRFWGNIWIQSESKGFPCAFVSNLKCFWSGGPYLL